MAEEKDSEGNISRLRPRAEESLSRNPTDMEDISALTAQEVQRLVHELRVHQIELEMQKRGTADGPNKIAIEDSEEQIPRLVRLRPRGLYNLGPQRGHPRSQSHGSLSILV